MSGVAQPVVAAGNQLGEGVLWCPRAQALYWTDILASTLWRHTPHDGTTRQWPMPERLASFALCEADGWLLLGLASQLAFFHLDSGALQPIADVEPDLPTRVNDGVCDRQGRFIFGTLHETEAGVPKQPIGGFYRLNADLSLQRLPLPSVAISNSLAFSPDGGTMYFCDSPTRRIQCCDYAVDGSVGAPRVFVDVAGIPGEPDGSTVDAGGGLQGLRVGVRAAVPRAHGVRADRHPVDRDIGHAQQVDAMAQPRGVGVAVAGLQPDRVGGAALQALGVDLGAQVVGVAAGCQADAHRLVRVVGARGAQCVADAGGALGGRDVDVDPGALGDGVDESTVVAGGGAGRRGAQQRGGQQQR